MTIVIGSADRMTPPRSGAALAALLANPPEIVPLAGAGHMMMTEAAADIRRILLDAARATT